MVSTFLRLNDYLLLEFFYEPKQYLLVDAPIIKVNSLYDNSVTIANEVRTKETGNQLTSTLVNIGNNHVAVNEGGIYLLDTAIDDKIYINRYNPKQIHHLMYNTIRIHVLSGYYFDDCDGLALNAYIFGHNKKLINLCNTYYLKNDTSRLQLNSKPLKISESIFDKYIDINVLSLNYLLQLQNDSPVIVQQLFGENIYDESELNLEVNTIQSTGRYGDYEFLSLNYGAEPVSTVVQTKSTYDTVSSAISVNQTDCCFEFRAEYKGDSIEDFIYDLNSRPGNDFYLNHTITVIEQVGTSFPIVDSYSMIQSNNYAKLFKFRPVLYNKMANAVSLEHEIQLINRVDGNGWSVRGSLTVPAVKLAGSDLRLVIPQGEFKVYNKIQTVKHNLVRDLQEVTKTKIIPTYINTTDVTVNQKVVIHPFRNNLSITIASKGSEVIKPNLTYYLVFLKSDNSKIQIKETIAEDIDRTHSLFFIIEEATAISIINSCTDTCYVIAKSSESESVITTVKWSKS